jgi:hypothetical protein
MRQQRELEAESIAFSVLAHFGMRLESRFYLASYDVNSEMLTASLQVIAATARTIISLIEQNNEKCEEGADDEDRASSSWSPLTGVIACPKCCLKRLPSYALTQSNQWMVPVYQLL